jgi:L-ascorbate metabolism protein UlaG (beta-lactamase superfamily)
MPCDHHCSRRLALSALAWLAVGVAAAQELSGDRIPTARGDLVIRPINHASFVMAWDGKTIYVDPVGGGDRFAGLPGPDLVLVTDIHGDHLDADTLQAIVGEEARILAPLAAAERLAGDLGGKVKVLANGAQESLLGLSVEAVPMYNLTAERLKYHEKGRGNGYLVTLGGVRVYISGDTEDIPEMRALEDIDVAFVCFNLPYTMTEEQAASAVREFAPGIVYPYHFRGSDVDEFTRLVGGASEVRVRDWY